MADRPEMTGRQGVLSAVRSGCASAITSRLEQRTIAKIVSLAAGFRFAGVLPCGVYRNTTEGKNPVSGLQMAQNERKGRDNERRNTGSGGFRVHDRLWRY